jgi:iron complex outermembrane recepter protein
MLSLVRELRCFVSVAAFLLAFALGSTTALASPRPFSIDVQEAPRSLLEFGRQSAVQILFASEKVKGVVTNAVHGNYEPIDALRLLLKGTPLVVSEKPDGVLVVEPQRDAQGVSNLAPLPTGEAGNAVRLAQSTTAGATSETRHSTDNPTSSSSGSPNYDKTALTEIIVTAQKREQRLMDVPISIVAVSADQLEKRNIVSIDDLASAVPGLAVSSDGGYSRHIYLRGISNVSGNSPAVGLYLDEASMTGAFAYSEPNIETYDLERVEVLRGPQGTLYGQGSIGGTIRFITKSPVLSEYEMSSDVTELFTQGGAPSERIGEVLNVPLVENELGLRIAGTFEHNGGWIDQPAADRNNINDGDLVDVRPKLLWQPTPQFTVNAMAVIHRDDTGLNNGEDSNGNYTQSFNLTTTPRLQDDYDLYNLTPTYDFGAVRILSTTTYVAQDHVTSNFGYVVPLSPPPAPTTEIYVPVIDIDSKIFTQELRATSIDAGPLNWTVGGSYQHILFNDFLPTIYEGTPIPIGAPLPSPLFSVGYSNPSRNWAAFGDASYKLADRLTLGIGLRYFQDDQEFISGDGDGTFQSGTFHSLDPRFYVEYKLSDQVNTYVSAAKGFRSGGFNQLNQPSYGPEEVWTYELGTKTSWAGGRLTANADVFYSNYTNYQIEGEAFITPTEILDITSNGGAARIKGVEGDFAWRPTDQWRLSFSGDYLNTRFTEINVTDSTYQVGDPLDFVPKYGYTISAQRDFIVDEKPAFVLLDYDQTGRENYRNRAIGPYYLSESDVIHMLNFRMGRQWSDQLSLSLFAQNLLNDRGFVDPLSIQNQASRPRPRTYGVHFEVKL